MAKRASKDVPFFLIGGWSVLGSLTQIEDMHEAVLERSDVLGDLYETHAFTGVRRAEITQEGFFDDGSGNAHEMLTTGPGTERVLLYGLQGTATGAGVECFAGAVEVQYQVQAKLGELHKAKASYKAVGPFEHGTLLRMLAAAGTTNQGTEAANYIDTGMSSTGLAAYLEYTSGGPAVVSIQHTSNPAGVWNPLMSFTNPGSGRGGERILTTAVAERYIGLQYSTVGVVGTNSFNFAAAVVRGLTS